MHALRGSWKIGIVTGVLVVVGILADAYAQVIGPLTNEDPKEISSMSGTCTHQGNQMKCRFIEMLVRQPPSAEDRKKDVESSIGRTEQRYVKFHRLPDQRYTSTRGTIPLGLARTAAYACG